MNLGAQGTISAGQIYGGYSHDLDLEEEDGDSGQASGMPKLGDKMPATVIIAFILLLVVIRVAYELAK